jgi:hypothetical protein
MKATIKQKTPHGEITITTGKNNTIEARYVLRSTLKKDDDGVMSTREEDAGKALRQVITRLEAEVEFLRSCAKLFRDAFDAINVRHPGDKR